MKYNENQDVRLSNHIVKCNIEMSIDLAHGMLKFSRSQGDIATIQLLISCLQAALDESEKL